MFSCEFYQPREREGGPFPFRIAMIDSNPKNKYQPLHRGLFLMPLALAIGFGIGIWVAPNTADENTRMHVELGESILQRGRLPVSIQVADGYCWMNDCYLTQIIMAVIARIGGIQCLAAASWCILLSVVALMMHFNRRDNVGWMATVAAALLVSAVFVQPWRIGPQVASIACFAALMALLQCAFDGWRGNWHWTTPRRWKRTDWAQGDDALNCGSLKLRLLWLAAPLFCVWANMHGAFRVGLVIFWTYLAVRGLEAVCQRGQAGWGLVRRMVLMGVVAGLATLVNPYGPWLYGWLSHPGTLTHREILHGSSIAIIGAEGIRPVFLLLIAFVLASHALSNRRCDLAQVAGLAVAGALTLGDARNATLFAIAAGFWIGLPLNDLWILIQTSICRAQRKRQQFPDGVFR